MDESVFKELLGEALRLEFAEFDDIPEHKFPLRHRLAMRRIFARYERNVRRLKKAERAHIPLRSESMPHYGIKQRAVFVLLIIILMTLLTGWFIPIRGITDVQIDWLRSRYDFPSMTMTVGQRFEIDPNAEYSALGVFRETDEYAGFLADLADMEIYSSDEIKTLKMKPSPIDTRPVPEGSDHRIKAIPLNFGDESPLDSYREYVASLEEDIRYYTERAKDPSRALEGDREFAESIAREYLPLPKSFVELLEKLFADVPDEDGSEHECLSELDKSDKFYLLEIHKI